MVDLLAGNHPRHDPSPRREAVTQLADARRDDSSKSTPSVQRDACRSLITPVDAAPPSRRRLAAIPRKGRMGTNSCADVVRARETAGMLRLGTTVLGVDDFERAL